MQILFVIVVSKFLKDLLTSIKLRFLTCILVPRQTYVQFSLYLFLDQSDTSV